MITMSLRVVGCQHSTWPALSWGTILVLAAFKATFDIDIIGSMVDTVTLLPVRIESEKNILEEFIEYLTGLFSEKLG